MSEFYVGYEPKAPTGLARLMRRTIAGLLVATATVALVLVFRQHPFTASTFEYQQYRTYEGTLRQSPYPTLQAGAREYLLVAPGKHGADSLVEGLDGQRLKVRASLISRDGRQMLEIQPESVMARAQPVPAVEQRRDLGTMTLSGEIVDSKCYLGVMNPGQGKVHRGCAARCIAGGIPPILMSQDGKTYLLESDAGRPLSRELLDYVAEPVRITGHVVQSREQLFLQLDPNTGIIRGR